MLHSKSLTEQTPLKYIPSSSYIKVPKANQEDKAELKRSWFYEYTLHFFL